jgi:hypothetical protein
MQPTFTVPCFVRVRNLASCCTLIEGTERVKIIWLALLLRILDVAGSNLGPYKCFCSFFCQSLHYSWGGTSKCQGRYLPHPSQFTFHNHVHSSSYQTDAIEKASFKKGNYIGNSNTGLIWSFYSEDRT